MRFIWSTVVSPETESGFDESAVAPPGAGVVAAFAFALVTSAAEGGSAASVAVS